MPVITINGQIGSAALEIGAAVARKLAYDYIDRLILAESAKRLGATIEALAQKEQRTPTRRERIGHFLNTLMERSAMAGTGVDPYIGSSLGVLLGQDYPQVMQEPITRADQLEDERFIEVTKSVIIELANEGNAVIIGRASNLILRGRPDAFHVGLVSTLDERIRTVAEREQVSLHEAKTIAIEHERARVAYHRKHFQTAADNPADFHLMLSTYLTHKDVAANIIADAFLTFMKRSP
ncbi:MAG: cytidylate kinase-like family protein [Chloroflexi bacterium]|nr:cytidylate kinase-like family protein [Chloroflexota bacterium]